MNLYIRLFWAMVTARFRARVSVLEELVTNHLVWPNDIDLLGHVNNGRYFTVTDNVRIGWLIKAGIWKVMKQWGLYPVMGGETAQFRKPLLPFRRFQIRSRTLGWDRRFFYVEHIFVSKEGVHAILLVKVIIVGEKKERVTPAEVIGFAHDAPVEEINVNEIIKNWNSSTDTQWANSKKYRAKVESGIRPHADMS